MFLPIGIFNIDFTNNKIYNDIIGGGIMDGLFNDKENNIDNMNIIQLADWLRKCRTKYRSEEDTYKNNYEKYVYDVSGFCKEWEKYAKDHIGTFNSIGFKQAAKLVILPQAEYVITMKNNEPINATDDFKHLQMENHISSDLKSKSIDREAKRVKSYQKFLKSYLDDGDRKELHKAVNYLTTRTFTHEVNILDKEADLTKKTVRQIISSAKRGKCKTVEREIIPEGKKTISDYLVEVIRKNQINKNVYYEYIKPKEANKKRVIKKMFFINLGFFLGLTLEEVEDMLTQEGYSIQNSRREDDKVVVDSFKYFFPQEYASALLYKKGYNKLEIGK